MTKIYPTISGQNNNLGSLLPRAFAVRGQDFEVKEGKRKLLILCPLSGNQHNPIIFLTIDNTRQMEPNMAFEVLNSSQLNARSRLKIIELVCEGMEQELGRVGGGGKDYEAGF